MSEKTTLIVSSAPSSDGQDAMQEYVQGVMPLLLALGGVVVKRSIFTEAYHGDKFFTYLLVMDFPSKQAVVEMFDSEDYQRLIPARDRGFANIHISFATTLK